MMEFITLFFNSDVNVRYNNMYNFFQEFNHSLLNDTDMTVTFTKLVEELRLALGDHETFKSFWL